MPAPTSMFSMQIAKIQDLQRRYLAMVESIRPSTGLGRAVKRVLLRSHREAVNITHVDTGALRASHITDLVISARSIVGTLFINRSTINPKHGERPYKYGITEHERGGDHAFYHRTFYGETMEAAKEAIQHLSRTADKPFRGI